MLITVAKRCLGFARVLPGVAILAWWFLGVARVFRGGALMLLGIARVFQGGAMMLLGITRMLLSVARMLLGCFWA